MANLDATIRLQSALLKTRRLIALASPVVGVAILACLAITTYWQLKQPKLQDASKLAAAVQAFSRDQAASGRTLPSSVSLRELVSGGYLAADDIRAFGGMDVAVSLTVDMTHPQEILIRVQFPDGSVMAGFADGSAAALR